jgi:hypothetical protein
MELNFSNSFCYEDCYHLDYNACNLIEVLQIWRIIVVPFSDLKSKQHVLHRQHDVLKEDIVHPVTLFWQLLILLTPQP